MTTPGFGTNPFSEPSTPTPPTPTPASAAPVPNPANQAHQPRQRSLVPVVCAIAILLALVIAGVVIWNDVRSASQNQPGGADSGAAVAKSFTPTSAPENVDSSAAQGAASQSPDTEASGPTPPAESTVQRPSPQPPTIRSSPAKKTTTRTPSQDSEDRPAGLAASGWSGQPGARCQYGEDMVFAAKSDSDPKAHIVICSKAGGLYYRGVWPKGAAFGPAKGGGDTFSVDVLNPENGNPSGLILSIHGNDYDIDGDAGTFDVHWSN